MEGKNAPLKEFREGDVVATVWENDYETPRGRRKFVTASLAKIYTDKTGTWKRSSTYTKRELTDAARVIEQAITYIETHEQPAP